jgi:Ca2+-binding EF-hand superfamily protein
MFTEADTNKDGFVDAAELDACMAKHGEKSEKHAAGGAAEMIKMFDQNGDNKLSATEHDAGGERMFAQADKNGDGMLSKAECDEAEKEMHKEHKM